VCGRSWLTRRVAGARKVKPWQDFTTTTSDPIMPDLTSVGQVYKGAIEIRTAPLETCPTPYTPTNRVTMSESGKSGHWNFLAEELGAEAKPAASKPASPPPSQPPRIRKKVEDGPKPEIPKSSWNDVALALGLEVPPPSAKPPATRPAIPPAAVSTSAVPVHPAAPPAADRDRDHDDVAPEGSRRDRPQHDRPRHEGGNRGRRDDRGGRGGRGRERGHGDDVPRGRGDVDRPEREGPSESAPYAESPPAGSPFAEDTDFEFKEIDIDDVGPGESSDASRAAEAPTGERPAASAGDRKSGRRRRRRRGGRSRDTADGQFEGERSPDDAGESPSDDEGLGTALDAEETGEARPDEDQGRAAEGGDELRPRRRRRRRGGRRRGGERAERGTREAGSLAPESSADSDDEPHAEQPDDAADFDEPSEAGGEHEHDADHDQAEGHDDELDGGDMKPSHRGIPSWEETIGVIVSANMESRAKNPNAGGAPRGRGRGRGRGHRP